MTAPLDDDLPLCSRVPNPERTTAEVRITLPVSLVATLDALAILHNSNRTALLTAAAQEYLGRHLSDARFLLRMAEGNPTSVEHPR
jgi:hypothetical protein